MPPRGRVRRESDRQTRRNGDTEANDAANVKEVIKKYMELTE